MSAATRPRPVRGEQFERVVRLPIDGQKRRRVLALIAAWHDAGAKWVPVGWIADVLELPHTKVRRLAQRLEADGYLVGSRRGGKQRYRLATDQERRAER